MTSRDRREIVVAVDRIERAIAIVESDEGTEFSVPVKHFRVKPREGMVYRVPLDAAGKPHWADAIHDSAAEAARKKNLAARMERLRGKDSGGDVEL